MRWFFKCTVLLLLHAADSASKDPRIKRDSYLSAYKLSHDLNEHAPVNFHSVHEPDESNLKQTEHTGLIDIHPINIHNHVDEVHPSVGFHPLEFHSSQEDPIDLQHHQPIVPQVHELPDQSEYNSFSGHFYNAPSVQLPATNPVNIYGAPRPVYVPPTVPTVHLTTAYSPSHRKPAYPAVPHYYEPEVSFVPSVLQNFLSPSVLLAILDKIKLFKVDLFTFGKLMLNFLILKKILSFFTILFLLLVIPNLQHKGKESIGFFGNIIKRVGEVFEGVEVDDEDAEEDEDYDTLEMRAYRKELASRSDEDLNSFAIHVQNALDSFERKFVRRSDDQITSTSSNATMAALKMANKSSKPFTARVRA